MKNKLKGLLLNWLINKSPEDDKGEKCYVSYDENTGYLHAFMPNGERIPHQVNMTLKDNLNEQMEVTITFQCEYKP